jgi:heptosyltransferase-1
MSSSAITQLLVVKPTSLGDVAQALGPVAALKEAMGDQLAVDWVVDEDYLPVLEAAPFLRRPIPFPRRAWRRRFSPGAMQAFGSRLRAGRYDIVLDLQGLARSGLMTFATGAPRRIGLASAREGSRFACTEIYNDRQNHAVDRYLGACSHIAGRPLELPAQVLRGTGRTLPAGLTSGKFTLLHPYSQWETKLWPWSRYEELAAARPEETFVVIGKGTPFPLIGPNILDLRGKTGLAELITLCGSARSMISTDSGPAHIAVAAGCPVVCLFGATDPLKTAPRGRAVRVLLHEMDCRPCLKRHCARPENVMGCLRGIGIDDVLKTWADLGSAD